jgi:hypothetical protein
MRRKSFKSAHRNNVELSVTYFREKFGTQELHHDFAMSVQGRLRATLSTAGSHIQHHTALDKG